SNRVRVSRCQYRACFAPAREIALPEGIAQPGGTPMPTVRTLTFADLLKRYRAAAGLTQEELATKSGLSPKGISDLERGARRAPRRDPVLLLADALGLAERERGIFAAAARQRPTSAIPTQDLPASLSTTSAWGAVGLPSLVGRTAELDLVERHLAGV